MKPEHIQWSKQHFASMADDGVWGVPRSGLVFQKKNGGLTLINRLPYSSEIPFGEEELDAYQRWDFEEIREHFAAAGIDVSWEEGVA